MKADLDLEAYLQEKMLLVEGALEEALPPTEDLSRRVVEAMRYSIFTGGKRLRPVLCLAGAEAVGGSAEAALPAAVALEMIHTYSLIHDDLPAMDDDDFRRGRPTSHKVFGEALAILAGDGLLTLGLAQLPRAATAGRLDPLLAAAALEVIARAAGHQGMVAGQAVDIESEGRDVGEEVVDFIHSHKTGALITAAVTSGAIIGRASADQLRRLEEYGRRLGLAFQIVDDILGVEGDAGTLGKPVGADQLRGKATYPRVAGLDRAKEKAKAVTAEARLALEGFGPAAEPLRTIAEYVLVRQK